MIRGTTKYHLSPFEQKAFAGVISTGLPNTLWRIRSSFFTTVPTFVLSYLIYDSAEKEHERLARKLPGQFDHETWSLSLLWSWNKIIIIIMIMKHDHYHYYDHETWSLSLLWLWNMIIIIIMIMKRRKWFVKLYYVEKCMFFLCILKYCTVLYCTLYSTIMYSIGQYFIVQYNSARDTCAVLLARSPDHPQRIRVASVFEFSVLCLFTWSLSACLQIFSLFIIVTSERRTVQYSTVLYSTLQYSTVYIGAGP